MKLFTHTLFFFLIVAQICFAQWFEQNSGTTKNLQDVVFLNATTGIAVGDSGIILRTTNGGASWSVIPTNVCNNLTSVSFVDEDNGWVAGTGEYLCSDSSEILRTTDSGLNWYVQSKKVDLPNDIFFIDQNTGFGCNGDEVFRTIDGGETWSDITFQHNGDIQRLHFTDQNTGWIITRGCGVISCSSWIYKTTDGGNSWQIQMDGEVIGLNDISFADSQNGIAVGAQKAAPPGGVYSGDFYLTSDGGENWLKNPGNTSFGIYDFVDVFHISDSVIAMWGNYWESQPEDVFYWSTDGGVTWQLRDSLQSNIPLSINRIFFTDTSNGWAVGDNGTILHTTNGGVSFVEEEQVNEAPTEFSLSQNFPNPFNPSTKIKYSVPQTSQVQIKVFDVLGNEIETLLNEEKQTGTYEIEWYAESAAGGLPSGVYFYQLRAGTFIETKKVVLLK